MDKAIADDHWRLCSWQPDRACYFVPSRTQPGFKYEVRWLPRPEKYRLAQIAQGRWWLLLECNCTAGVSSRYALCWHKAAVWWLHQHPRTATQLGSGQRRERPKIMEPDRCEETHGRAWVILTFYCPECEVTRSPLYARDFEVDSETGIQLPAGYTLDRDTGELLAKGGCVG